MKVVIIGFMSCAAVKLLFPDAIVVGLGDKRIEGS
jgi:hypothetical protein